ncbi:MAG: AAA family ATPase [Methylobacterium radiotolerans]
MKIERLTISNFRCFGPDPVTIAFEDAVTAFVGNNGSGKTAVFAALGRLFGVGQGQRSVTKTDFHVPYDARAVASGSRLALDCVFGFEGAVGGAAVPDVFGHMTVGGPGQPLKLRIRLEATWTDDLTPGGAVDEDVRWVAALDDGYDWSTCARVSLAERGFVQLIYVPASRNAADQVTALLKGRLWRAANWSSAMSGAAEAAGVELQGLFEADPPSAFISERLRKRWDEVHRGDTTARPALRLLDSRLDDLVRRAEFTFLPDETGHARTLGELSDGQRSLFHIALTAATLEMERDVLAAAVGEVPFDRDKLRRTYLTILAVEEPENSLSPFFLARIMSQARDVGGIEGAQVVVSSHSPSILGRVEPEEVRYARLVPETRTSDVRSLALPEDGTQAGRFVRLAVRAYPELYFARFVILAEGESEAIVLPRIAEAMGIELDRSFVPIVPLGGRFVRHFWRLLAGLDIPYATLLDLDLGRKHGGANAIAAVVTELGRVQRELGTSFRYDWEGTDPERAAALDEGRLLRRGHRHGWLRALAKDGVFFSAPVDVDFAMLAAFPEAYMRTERGRRGSPERPQRGRGQADRDAQD